MYAKVKYILPAQEKSQLNETLCMAYREERISSDNLWVPQSNQVFLLAYASPRVTKLFQENKRQIALYYSTFIVTWYSANIGHHLLTYCYLATLCEGKGTHN